MNWTKPCDKLSEMFLYGILSNLQFDLYTDCSFHVFLLDSLSIECSKVVKIEGAHLSIFRSFKFNTDSKTHWSDSVFSLSHDPWCPYDGKVFQNVLWRKTGSPQPLNKPLFLLRCQAVLVEGPRLLLEFLESLRYIEIVVSRHHLTSNYD